MTEKIFDNDLISLGNSKFESMKTWKEISEELNNKYGISYGKDFYRKRFNKLCNNSNIEHDDLSDMLLSIKKERVKLIDEVVQNNAYIRRLSREETIKEIASDIAHTIGREKFLPKCLYTTYTGQNSAILQLSDWHYGIECENYWNLYNPEICKERVSKLLKETISYCTEHKIKDLYVLNLSDLISGRIHLTLRLQSRFDVLTQVIHVSEILAEFLNELSGYFTIHYYDCNDNHSRIEPKKTESLDLESLTRIIHWYLVKRFENNDKINIYNNKYSDDIITFKCCGHNIAAVHGDKDSPGDVVEKISLMTGEKYDLLLMGHLHHFGADEVDECLVVQNGSLMGTDYYAVKLRKRSKPSQNIILINYNNAVEDIHRIIF